MRKTCSLAPAHAARDWLCELYCAATRQLKLCILRYGDFVVGSRYQPRVPGSMGSTVSLLATCVNFAHICVDNSRYFMSPRYSLMAKLWRHPSRFPVNDLLVAPHLGACSDSYCALLCERAVFLCSRLLFIFLIGHVCELQIRRVNLLRAVRLATLPSYLLRVARTRCMIGSDSEDTLYS